MMERKTIVRVTLLAIAASLALTIFLVDRVIDVIASDEAIAQVSFPTVSYEVLVANTQELRIQGLSGREVLEENQGMLFIFKESDVRNFWMKEMNFPIDIIWIDDTHTVTGFVQNALPESYPESFSSNTPVQYVLEVNAGHVEQYNIAIGDRVTFSNLPDNIE